MNTEIEKLAEQSAIEAGYPQSDKKQFTATYWTYHNKYGEGFVNGYKAALNKRDNNDAIEKAIKFCDEKYNSVSEEEYGKTYMKVAYNQIKEYLQSLLESQPKKEEVLKRIKFIK